MTDKVLRSLRKGTALRMMLEKYPELRPLSKGDRFSLACAIEEKLGLNRPGTKFFNSPRGRIIRCAYFVLSGIDLLKTARAVAKPGLEAECKRFYQSHDWARIRYEAIKLNDGRCEACGRSKQDGIVLHVDHIKNLKDHWHLRLEVSNLQVLCETCNWGKGNKDHTDWRLAKDHREPFSQV